MSGFCGIVNYSRAGSASRESLGKMLAAIAHRGPDGKALHVHDDGSFALGHQLLALKEPPAEFREPVSDEKQEVWVVTDGWIANYDELRQKLEAKGVRFRSRLDAELILRLYLDEGDRFVETIGGAACFALYDSRQRKLLLVRDRLGVKSLYYIDTGGCIIFASEIRALLAHPAVKRELEPVAIQDFLYTRRRPAPLTMFKDIRKARAAEAVAFDASGARTERRYWTPLSGEVLRDKSEAFFVEGIRERFARSVKTCMRTCRNVGAFLSGGLDSSAVVSQMSEFASGPVHTFSIGFRANPDDQPDEWNELPYARLVAERFGTTHREAWMFGRDFMPALEEVINSMEDLSLASEQVMLLFAIKMAKKAGVPVILSGEGGLEEYTGSGTYAFLFNTLGGKWAKIRKMPLIARKMLFRAAEILKFNRRAAKCYDFTREWLWLLANNRELYLQDGMLMNELFMRTLFTNDFMKTHGAASPYHFYATLYKEIYATLPAPDRMQVFGYCDWRGLIGDILNMEVEKLGAAHNVDVRPAIDPAFAEFLFRIPGEARIAGGEPRRLFKKAMEGKVPREILERKKAGFSSGLEKFIHDTTPRALRQALEGSALQAAGHFNAGRIAEMLQLHESGKADYTWPILALLMLHMWHKRWIQAS